MFGLDSDATENTTESCDLAQGEFAVNSDGKQMNTILSPPYFLFVCTPEPSLPQELEGR